MVILVRVSFNAIVGISLFRSIVISLRSCVESPPRIMARRRYFTLDEALAQVLDEEDDWIFGTADSAVSDGESDNESTSTTGAPVRSADRSSGSDSDTAGDDNRGSSPHFLDQHPDAETAAGRFLTAGAGDEGRSESDGEGGERSESGASLCPNRSQLMRCGCDRHCLSSLDLGAVEANRLSLMELGKSEKEALVLGVLQSCRFDEERTAKGKLRKKASFAYQYDGRRVCVGAFRHIYDLGQKQLRNIVAHLSEHGAIPRVHGNTRRLPHNALRYPEIFFCVTFVKNYAERYGIPHPAPLYGRAGDPPIFLPASQNFKTVHAQYVASCIEANIRSMGISSFRSVWHRCLPNIRFMTPRTDVCDKCERLRMKVTSAISDEQKAQALSSFSNHLQHAQRERDYYQQCTAAAFEELNASPIAAPPHCPCSRDLVKVHYTFDFAQMLQLPHSARQVGPIYFKTPRKVQLFGVCCEGLPRQMNYLIDEAQTIGVNGIVC